MSYRESEKYIRCSFSRAFRIYAQIPVKVKKICFWQKTECSPFGDFGFFGHFLGIYGIIDIINWFFINFNSSRSVYILKSSRKKFKIVFLNNNIKKKKKFFFGIPGPNPWCPSVWDADRRFFPGTWVTSDFFSIYLFCDSDSKKVVQKIFGCVYSEIILSKKIQK